MKYNETLNDLEQKRKICLTMIDDLYLQIEDYGAQINEIDNQVAKLEEEMLDDDDT